MSRRARDSGDFGGIRVDAEEWPLLRVGLPADISADALEGYTDFTSEVRYRKPGPYILVFEVGPSITPSQRQIVFADPGDQAEGKGSPCLGAAVVMSSWLRRLTGRLATSGAPHPVHVTSSVADATRWGRRQLRERGVFEAEADSMVGDVNDLAEPPTVEAVAVPVPDAEGRYWVEVGSFFSERRAHMRADTMLDQGLVTAVQELPGMARPRYVVRLGPFGDSSIAGRARAAILDFVPDATVVESD